MLIKPLKETDYSAWSTQYVDYAKPWNEPISAERLSAVWNILLKSENGAYGVGIFDSAESLLGFGHYILTPCTYSRRYTCYLQDLYVVPEARREGIARKFMAFLETEGRAAGWRSINWKTRPGNDAAVALYDKIARRSDWIFFELPLS